MYTSLMCLLELIWRIPHFRRIVNWLFSLPYQARYRPSGLTREQSRPKTDVTPAIL